MSEPLNIDTYINLDDYKLISTLGITESAYPGLPFWIDAANAVMCTFNFEEGQKGFRSVAKIIAVGIIDYFFSVSRKNAVLAANSPFKSERLGSYAYTRFSPSDNNMQEGIIQSLPGHVLYLLLLFLKKGKPRSIVTRVFDELPPDSQGERSYAEILIREYPFAYDDGILGPIM